jgi:hypothetical protein
MFFTFIFTIIGIIFIHQQWIIFPGKDKGMWKWSECIKEKRHYKHQTIFSVVVKCANGHPVPPSGHAVNTRWTRDACLGKKELDINNIKINKI